MMSENIFVGIDVAKATLDVAFGVTGKVITFSNTPEGHDSLSAALVSADDPARSLQDPAPERQGRVCSVAG